MKLSILTALAMFVVTAGAEPCFHPGTYRGKGFANDTSGNFGPYDVETVLTSNAEGRSSYVWSNGGHAAFSFGVNAGNLLIDGKDVGGKAECTNAVQRLHIPFGNFWLNEEWLFTGNYLLRTGKKVTASGTVEYQELLIREI